ncbi:hypothetical protein RYO59_000895 [Thermosynechococcaceae cyanobacterium Okahandja]
MNKLPLLVLVTALLWQVLSLYLDQPTPPESTERLCSRAIAAMTEELENHTKTDIVAAKITRIHPSYDNPHPNRRFS